MNHSSHSSITSFSIATLLTLPLLLGACSSSSPKAAAGDAAHGGKSGTSQVGARSSSITPEAGIAAAAWPAVEIQPGTATDKYEGARADVDNLTCVSDKKGTWKVAGSVTNSTDQTVNYRIYSSFLVGTETKGLIQVDVSGVEAKQSKKWEGSTNIASDKLECVLRVERIMAK